MGEDQKSAMIKVRCPNPACRKILAVKAELAGRKGRCPLCKQAMSIPKLPSGDHKEAPPTAPPPPPTSVRGQTIMLTASPEAGAALEAPPSPMAPAPPAPPAAPVAAHPVAPPSPLVRAPAAERPAAASPPAPGDPASTGARDPWASSEPIQRPPRPSTRVALPRDEEPTFPSWLDEAAPRPPAQAPAAAGPPAAPPPPAEKDEPPAPPPARAAALLADVMPPEAAAPPSPDAAPGGGPVFAGVPRTVLPPRPRTPLPPAAPSAPPEAPEPEPPRPTRATPPPRQVQPPRPAPPTPVEAPQPSPVETQRMVPAPPPEPPRSPAAVEEIPELDGVEGSSRRESRRRGRLAPTGSSAPQKEEVRYELDGGTLRVSGPVGYDLDPKFSQYCRMLLEGPAKELMIDLSDVPYLSSTYLGVLAPLFAQARDAGRTITLRAQGKVSRVLRLAGFDRLGTLVSIDG